MRARYRVVYSFRWPSSCCPVSPTPRYLLIYDAADATMQVALCLVQGAPMNR
jgi:hypothetical protein